MIVIGLLLIVFVSSSMGQDNATNASNNASASNGTNNGASNGTNSGANDGANNGTSPSTGGTTAPTTTSKNANFGFDCRRRDASCGSGQCVLDSGKCSCGSGSGNFSYNCQDISPDTVCNIPCVNGGACHGGKCVCTANYYGTSCNLTRAQVLCKGQQMFVNINPIDNFTGSIYVQGHESCNFTSNNSKADAVDFTTELAAFPGLEGRWRVLQFTDSACGNATVTDATDGGTAYVHKIYVQYVDLFKSAVDQIVVAECVVTNGTTTVSSSDVSNVTESNGNLEEVNAGGKVDAVTLKIYTSDKKTLAKTVTLGDEIHLVFSMPISPGSTYNDFRLRSCDANNTLKDQGLKYLQFIENGCPTAQATAIFFGEPQKETTNDSSTIDVKLKAFMFVGSSPLLGFICTVDLCARGNTQCNESSCSASTNTPPASSATDNSTTSAPPTVLPTVPTTIVRKRKRDAADTPKEATIGTNAVTVVSPGEQDTTPGTNGEVTGEKPTMESCPVDQQFVAAVAILGVCVLLLLLLSSFLIFRLMKSKKSIPERPDHYPRPVEGLRFPRLELNSAHENAF